MRVNNFIIKNISESNDKIKTLKKGSIIKGKISSIEGNNVKIDLGNGTIINGRTQIALEQQKNKVISFLIKSISDSNLILTPILDEEGVVNKQNPLINTILQRYNIENNQKNQWIVKNLIQYKMPVDSETVENISNLVNSIEGLLRAVKNDRMLLMGNDSKNLFNDNISKVLTNIIQREKLIIDRQYENLNENIKLDEKHAVYTKKNFKDTLKNFLLDILPNERITENLVRKILFLVKSDLEVSINNLKLLSDFIEGKIFIDKNIKEIVDLLEKQGINVKEIKNELTNLNSQIDFDFTDKSVFKNYYKNITSILAKLESIIKDKEIMSKDILENFDKLMDKTDFIYKLNLEHTFIFYPINIGLEEIYDKIYLLNKNKKNGKKTNRLTIYMNLETLHLGKIEVLCTIIDKSIDLKFSLVDKKVVKVLEKEKDGLHKAISNCGFSNITIDLKIKDKGDTEILNLFIDDFREQQSVDLRV